MPITACNGATESPWPKEIVTVFSSPQRLGTIGMALSGDGADEALLKLVGLVKDSFGED